MATEPIVIAIIASIQIVAIAVIQLWSKKSEAAIRSREKREDYARQDEVANRVAAAAREVSERAALLVHAQAETIKRTDEVAKAAAESSELVQAKLREIHTLVNSDMTAARSAERDSQALLVLSIKRAHALSTKLGVPPTQSELDELTRSEKRIDELNLILADRKAAQDRVDADVSVRKGGE